MPVRFQHDVAESWNGLSAGRTADGTPAEEKLIGRTAKGGILNPVWFRECRLFCCIVDLKVDYKDLAIRVNASAKVLSSR